MERKVYATVAENYATPKYYIFGQKGDRKAQF